MYPEYLDLKKCNFCPSTQIFDETEVLLQGSNLNLGSVIDMITYTSTSISGTLHELYIEHPVIVT